MGNCLVSKLKSTVTNDSLETLGVLKIQFKPTFNLTLTFDSNDFYIDLIGFTYNGQNKIKPSDSGLVYIDRAQVVSTADNLYITMPKYKVTTIGGGSIGVDASRIWGDSITTLHLQTGSSVVNAREISGYIDNLVTFIINGTVDSGFDVSRLGITGNLRRFSVNTPMCYGTMDNIGFSPLDNLTGEIRFPQTKNVTFVVENFVANNVISGRTSGSRTEFLYIGGCDAKFKDSPVNAVTNNTITWSESSGNTAITFNGVSTTIHVNSNGTWTRVS